MLPAQQGVFVELAVHPSLYVGQQRLELIGPVDADRLDECWHDVRAAHGALRTSFREHDGQLLQLVWDRPDASRLHVFDLSAVRPGDRSSIASAICDEDLQRGIDVSRGPVARLSLVRFSAELAWLCVTHHHIGVDGRSLTLLYDELARRYEGSGVDSISVPSLTETLRALRRTRASGGSHPTGTPQELSTFAPARSAPVLDTAMASASLESLIPFAESLGCTPAAVALASWLHALARLRGSSAAACAVSHDIRPSQLARADRTVGMLTETSLISVDVPAMSSLADVAQQVQASLVGERRFPALGAGLRTMWREGSTGRPDTLVTIYSASGLPPPPDGLSWQLIDARETTEFAVDATLRLGADLKIVANCDVNRVTLPAARHLLSEVCDLVRHPHLVPPAVATSSRVFSPMARVAPSAGLALGQREVVESIARRVLGRAVEFTQNLSSAGVDSLALIGLAAGLADAGWRLSVGEIMELGSLEDVSRHVAAIERDARADLAAVHTAPADPSPIESDWLERTGDRSLGTNPLHEQSILAYGRKLDATRFRDAINRCLAHLPSLDRCWDGSDPPSLSYREGMAPDVEVLIARADSTLTSVVKRLRAEDIRHPFRPNGEPLMRFRLILGCEASVLQLSFHYSLLDGWSFATFIRSLQAAYELDPLQTLPGSDSGTYRTWCRQRPPELSGLATGLGNAASLPRVPLVRPRPLKATSPAHVSGRLVRQAAERLSVSAAVVIQAAAVETCCDILDQPRRSPIALRMSVRDGSPHASLRTVGHLTADVPMLPGRAGLREQARRVRDTIAAAYTSGHAGNAAARVALRLTSDQILTHTVIAVENYFRFDEDMLRLVDTRAWPELFSWRRDVTGAPRAITLCEHESGWTVEIATVIDAEPDALVRRFARHLNMLLRDATDEGG